MLFLCVESFHLRAFWVIVWSLSDGKNQILKLIFIQHEINHSIFLVKFNSKNYGDYVMIYYCYYQTF